MDNLISLFNQQIANNNASWFLLVISFLGGIVASLSPCTLGILPIIVGYVAGYGKNQRLQTFIQLIFFIIGMSLVLTAIGIFCAIGGKVFLTKHADIWALLLNAVIVVMGLNLLGVLDFSMPVIIKSMPQNNDGKYNLILYPILVGGAFALAATPCSTPILAGIMAFASLSANLLLASLMLFLFALGQGVVIVIAGVFTSLFTSIKAFHAISIYLMKTSGIILLLGATYIYYKIFSAVI